MAAVSDAQILQVLRLKDVSPAQLDPVLDEETAAWENRLEWDFRPSGDLVRRFVRMQALSGFALIAAGRIAGYSYYVCEEHKGLVGDLYVCDEFASPENENRLLGAVLHEMMRMSYVRRIESQLMMLRDAPGRPLPYIQHLRRYPRKFMVIDLARVSELAPGAAGNRVHIDRWNDNRQEEAAQLIAAAYRGHIDSEINDQYRSVPGARRFLMNIVQYPGCGSFHASASWFAVDPSSGRLLGLSLASVVGPASGHITQICVAPDVKGRGLGYELMRRSLEALAQEGKRHTSLTVTAGNTGAVALYERMHFTTRRDFAAHVWEGF